MKIIAVHRYVGKAREIARRIKNATDDDALERAAEEMAPHVPAKSILVPAPSSSGLNPAMAVLALKIAALVPRAKVIEAIVRKTPVQSSHLLRKAGKPAVLIEQHVASMKQVKPVPPKGSVVIIDNVVTEGNTARAMEQVLGRPVTVVVYADASREPRKNPSGALRVCISGSRNFVALELVDEIIKLLPDGTVVVHGGAAGVDERADQAAHRRGLKVEEWAPDWEQYGKAAGPIRNRDMVKTCDYLYALWDGRSKGTASAIEVARQEQVDYEVILDVPA